MKGWVRVLLFILLVGLLIQCTLYFSSRHLAQHVEPNPAADLFSTDRPQPAARDVRWVVNGSFPYPFLINQPDACGRATELVIVVITAVKNFADRAAVRETWGAYAAEPAHNTSLVFLLGTTSSLELQAALVNESDRYRDIVQGGFVDSYRNLSTKSVALLKWVMQFCNSSKFVMKVDDDMYVNMPNLLSALKEQKTDMFILGHAFEGAVPIHNKQSKWYTSKEEFSENKYPRYASGTAYSMSTKAALVLYEAAQKVPSFWLEDIYVTGLCARKAGVRVVHNGGFNYQHLNPTGCVFRNKITGHQVTADEKRKIHQELHDPNLRC